MEQLGAFFHMGGYAAFIWPAFGITALVLVVLFFVSRRDWRMNEAALETLERQGGTRRRRQRLAAEAETPPAGTVPRDA